MNYSQMQAPGHLTVRKWWVALAKFGTRFTRIEDKDLKRHRIVVRGALFNLAWVWSDDHASNRPGVFTMDCPTTKTLRIISDTEFAVRIAGVWSHFVILDEPAEAQPEPKSTAQPEPEPKPLTPQTMVKGGRYNWQDQPERLTYLGKNWSGNGYWHQFEKVDEPGVVWCEVRDSDLTMFEETK